MINILQSFCTHPGLHCRSLGRQDTSVTAMVRAMVSHCQALSSGWRQQRLPREMTGSLLRFWVYLRYDIAASVAAFMSNISFKEIWQSQVQKAVAFLSSSSSSSSSSSEQSSFTGSSVSSSTGTFSSADLIQQILLAIQPQVVQAVQSVVSSQSTSVGKKIRKKYSNFSP